MANHTVHFDEAAMAQLSRATSAEPARVQFAKGKRPVNAGEVLVAVFSSEGGVVRRAKVGRDPNFRELLLWLAGTEAAVERCAAEPSPGAPQLTAGEAALLDEAGLRRGGEGAARRPGSLRHRLRSSPHRQPFPRAGGETAAREDDQPSSAASCGPNPLRHQGWEELARPEVSVRPGEARSRHRPGVPSHQARRASSGCEELVLDAAPRSRRREGRPTGDATRVARRGQFAGGSRQAGRGNLAGWPSCPSRRARSNSTPRSRSASAAHDAGGSTSREVGTLRPGGISVSSVQRLRGLITMIPRRASQARGILYAAASPVTCLAEVFQATRVIDRRVRFSLARGLRSRARRTLARPDRAVADARRSVHGDRVRSTTARAPLVARDLRRVRETSKVSSTRRP